MTERVAPARLGLAFAVVVAVGVAGCGGGGAASSSSTAAAAATTTAGASGTAKRSATTSRAAPPKAATHRYHVPAVHGAKLGTTQDVRAYGALLHVTATSVSPVAKGQAALPPGYRGVAVQLRVADEAGATYDSTASGDWSLILSSGMSAPLDVRSGPCETQLVDFESHLYSGDVRPGCVAFSVAEHARVLGVRFSPHAHAHGSVTWRLKS